jgi:hypothetical protein
LSHGLARFQSNVSRQTRASAVMTVIAANREYAIFLFRDRVIGTAGLKIKESMKMDNERTAMK